MIVSTRSISWLLTFGLLAACGGDTNNGLNDAGDGSGDIGTDNDAGSDATADTGINLASCDDNFDCRGGEVCRGGLCREACAESDPCTGPLAACDDAAGFCVQCLEDTDCPSSRICVGRICEFFCTDDDACPQGQRCNLTSGECLEPECEGDADCPGGFACRAFVCSPIDEQICTPDTSTCQGNSVVTCSRDGTQFRSTSCEAGERCVADSPTAAECRVTVCSPDSIGCIDAASAYSCDATGTVQTRVPCGRDEFCVEGVCEVQACEPGATRCEGDSLATCDALGSSETIIACDDTEECADATFGCRCTGGECFVRRCTPGATRCVGSGFQECDEQGANWSAVETCPGATTCRDGACR